MGRELANMIGALLAGAWDGVRRRWGVGLLVLGLTALAATFTLSHDQAWLARLTTPRDEGLWQLSWALSFWGDYHTGSLGVALLLGVVARLTKRRALLAAALASFLGASLGGLSTNAIRATAGRPRPIANVPDDLYGPNLIHAYQGFPSSHCGTAFGTAGALLVAAPAVGAVAIVGAAAVGWSRMYQRRHHPTDVFVGSVMGLLSGACFGVAARRRFGSSAARRGEEAR